MTNRGLHLALLVLCSQLTYAENEPLRFGTGAKEGIYYQFGAEVTNAINSDGGDGLSVRLIETNGSVDNLALMKNGALDFAIVQNDIAYYVYEGGRGFQSFSNFSAGIPLFAEYIQVLVRTDGEVRTLGDLERQTVSLGPETSGSYQNALDLMAEAGLRPGIDFEAVYLDLSDALQKLRAMEIDAVITTGATFPSLEEDGLVGVRVLSLSREIVTAMTMQSPYYVAATPERNVGESSTKVSTVSVLAFLILSDRVTKSQAAQIIEVIERQRPGLQTISENDLTFVPIEETDLRRPVPLHDGVRSYLLSQGHIASDSNQYWGVLVGVFLIGLVIYAQVRCNAYDRLGNVRSASGAWSYRLMLALSRFNTLIIVAVLFAFVLFALVESIQFFEAEYARKHNIRNEFADIGFWDAVLWMFMFMGSGHTANIFPLSGPGRVMATTLPFLGIGGVLGFSLLGLDESRARNAERKRGRLPTKAKGHVLVCGWNEKAKGIVYGLTSDDVPRKKHVVVVAEIDGDMPLENHDFDPRFVSYQRGDSADHSVLARANIGHADAAVVVAGVKKRAGRNVRSILSVMALKASYAKARAHHRDGQDELFVTAELLYDENRPLFHACGADAVVTAELVANRVVAQSCVNSHIVDFVLDALTYDDASELYSTRVKRIGKPGRGLARLMDFVTSPGRRSTEAPPLEGKTLNQVRSELAKHGINVVAAAQSRKYDEILIDDVFDNGQYKFPQDPVDGQLVLTGEHVLLFFADDHSDVHVAARRATRRPWPEISTDTASRASTEVSPETRKVLLVGDWDRCRSVREILQHVPWCEVTILTETAPSNDAESKNVTVGDLAKAENWRTAGLLEVDQITILAQSGEQTNAGQNRDDHGEIDARAIFTARFARNFYRQLGATEGHRGQPPIVAAEMLGHRSRTLFVDAQVDVIVPSSLLVERMLTKLVYSKGSVCRFLMALLAFDDGRHVLTITLCEERHGELLNRSYEELMGFLPINVQLLGILPGDPDERKRLLNPVADFDYHILTAPGAFGMADYRSKVGDELLVLFDRRK